MRRASKAEIEFVRALLATGTASRTTDGSYRSGKRKLGDREVAELASQGVVARQPDGCVPRPEAKSWVRRQLLATDELAAQHRLEARGVGELRLNLDESPLQRLALGIAGEVPFLDRHHIEAGERVRRLVERAQLRQRVTMSYTASRTAGRRGAGHAGDITDMAADARTELSRLYRLLPHECADVVLDICGFAKGLQTVETERRWPRRSAKLVLRIGLEHLARHYGYGPTATGVESRRRHAWLDEGARPTVFE